MRLTDTPPPTTADTARVLAQLGAAGLGIAPEEPPRDGDVETDADSRELGDITLHAHQRSAVARLRRTLPRFGGALLADDVGLGKTFVALAVARTYGHACVIAPATLRATWRDAIQRAGPALARVRVHSLHRFSRSAPTHDGGDAPHHAARDLTRLVILDEAHHLRNAATRRYAAIADFCRGAHVLLLSATPVYNHERDLAQLFALFLGQAAHTLSAADRLRLIVRRRVHDTDLPLPPPRLHALPSRYTPDVPDITTAIMSLPPPLPTRDGHAAGALVALGLLRAWCSSAAACLALVQRRRLRTAALHSALHDGRWPSTRELRSWSIGDDAVQLGFTALLVPDTAMPKRGDSRVAGGARPSTRTQRDAQRTLATHRDALDRLAVRVREVAPTIDRTRVGALRAIRAAHRHATVLAFSQFAETVHALGRLMRWDDGVATLTARGGHVAGGRIARTELIARVAPAAHGRAEPPAHERIRLLITTDLLAEGVNLQDASVVVHLDQPWTPAALAQREGRIARLGSRHRDVYTCTIHPPGGSAAALALAERLRRKAGAADRALHPERTRTRTEPAPALVALLQAWCDAGDGRRAQPAEPTAAPQLTPAVARVTERHARWCWQLDHAATARPSPATRVGWLAAITLGSAVRLVGGWTRGTPPRTTASQDPQVLHALALDVRHRLARGATMTAMPSPGDAVARDRPTASPTALPPILRALRRARSQWHVHALVDTAPSAVWNAQRALRALLHDAPLAERIALGAESRALAARLASLRGVGSERALEALLRQFGTMERQRWLAALRALLDESGVPDVQDGGDDDTGAGRAATSPRPHETQTESTGDDRRTVAPDGIITLLLLSP